MSAKVVLLGLSWNWSSSLLLLQRLVPVMLTDIYKVLCSNISNAYSLYIFLNWFISQNNFHYVAADAACLEKGGKCVDYMQNKCELGYEQFLCSGDSENRCCFECADTDDTCKSFSFTKNNCFLSTHTHLRFRNEIYIYYK